MRIKRKPQLNSPLFPTAQLMRELPEMVEDEMTKTDIAKHYGVHPCTIQYWCRKLGITLPRSNPDDRHKGAIQRARIVKGIQEGKKGIQIAREMGITPGRVNQYLEKLVRAAILIRVGFAKYEVSAEWIRSDH